MLPFHFIINSFNGLITPLFMNCSVNHIPKFINKSVNDLIAPYIPPIASSAPFPAFSQSPVNVPTKKSHKPFRLLRVLVIKSPMVLMIGSATFLEKSHIAAPIGFSTFSYKLSPYFYRIFFYRLIPFFVESKINDLILSFGRKLVSTSFDFGINVVRT